MDRVSNNQGEITLPLRAACIHGRYEAHGFDHEPLRTHCPGGREVTIDREALLDFLIGFHRWGEVEVDMLVGFLFGDTDE